MLTQSSPSMSPSHIPYQWVAVLCKKNARGQTSNCMNAYSQCGMHRILVLWSVAASTDSQCLDQSAYYAVPETCQGATALNGLLSMTYTLWNELFAIPVRGS